MTSNVNEVTNFLFSERRQADSGRCADASVSYTLNETVKSTSVTTGEYKTSSEEL